MKRSTVALAGLLTGRLAWQGILARRGLVAASGDDFLRILIAWDWAHAPFFMAWRYAELSWAWLPLPFWVTGSVLRIWARPDLVPRLLSVVLGLLSLVLLWRLWVRVWGFSVAMPAVVCVASIPWHLWLGGTATAQPLFHCLVATGILLALSRRPRAVVGAGLAFGLSTAVRPEGWLLTILWVAWLALGRRGENPLVRLASGAAACAFPAIWTLAWWQKAGDPFLLPDAGARYQELAMGSARSLLLRLLQFPFVVFITSPLLVALCLIGLLRRRCTLFGTGVRAYTWLSVGFLVAMLLSSAVGMGTTSAPQRYALLPLVLLAPFGVEAVGQGIRRWTVVGLIAAVGLWGSWHVPRRYTFLWNTGDEIGDLIRAGALPSETLICAQEAWEDLTGAPDAGRSPVSVCEEWGLAVASRRPGSVVCSRRGGFLDAPGRPSCRGITYDQLPTALSEKTVLLVTREESAVAGAFPDLELLALRGPYRIWGPARLGRCFTTEQECPVTERALDHVFADGLRLRAVGWESRLLPPRVYLCWLLDRPTAWDLRPHLALESVHGQVTRYPLPRFRDAWPRRWLDGNAMTAAELHVPQGSPAGAYQVRVGIEMGAPEVAVGSVVLGSSKREVLLALLRGEASGWAKLLKILLF